jgi:hypothetical protein
LTTSELYVSNTGMHSASKTVSLSGFRETVIARHGKRLDGALWGRPVLREILPGHMASTGAPNAVLMPAPLASYRPALFRRHVFPRPHQTSRIFAGSSTCRAPRGARGLKLLHKSRRPHRTRRAPRGASESLSPVLYAALGGPGDSTA